MVSEKDIYLSASALRQKHREDAEEKAAQNADSLRAQGDMEGDAVWLRIKAAVVEMQKKAPSPDDTIQ